MEVIRRLLRDLDLPIALRVMPTVRDADGLALSSRNVRLSPADRERALALPRALATEGPGHGAGNAAGTGRGIRGAGAVRPPGACRGRPRREA